MTLRTRAALAHALVTGWIVAACGGAAGKGPGAAPTSAPPASHAAADEEESADGAPLAPPKEVDCGDFTTCAIATDGLARCWGRDKEGELGAGKGKGDHAKRVVVPNLGKVKKVALASRFGCALLEDGRVKCWGTGRIANDGKAFTEAGPTLVKGVERVEELVASGAIACARGARGVACWGTNDESIAAPPAGAFTQIAAGFTHACALDARGAAACWGAGDWGAKGIFTKPAGVTGARQIVTGDRHACVVTKSRAVQCWGMNDAGQLGVKPDMEPHKKPVMVPKVTGVERLVAGEASTCALLEGGAVRCWGANGEGELGLGTRSPDERPTSVPALSGVEQMCLASTHGCALTKEHELLCWGANAFGQVGDGTRERRPAPTAVAW